MHTTIRPYVSLIALAAISAAAATAPAMAQFVQVSPGVYQSVAAAPSAYAGVPFSNGVYQQVPVLPAAPVGPSGAQVDATIRLSLTSEEQVSDTVTRARYTANNVVVTINPVDGFLEPMRIVGRVDVVTQTTLDADGNGTIDGTLTFTARSRSGMVAQLFTLRLSGAISDSAGPLSAVGALRVPATSRFETPVSAGVSAELASDANLTAHLMGQVQPLTF